MHRSSFCHGPCLTPKASRVYLVLEVSEGDVAGHQDIHQTQAEIPGARVTFKAGRLAVQAAGACTAFNGDTQILGTVHLQEDDGLRFRDPLEHFEVHIFSGS